MRRAALLVWIAGWASAQEAWQNSYDIFAQEVAAFLGSGQNVSIFLARYGGQPATWEGVFAGIERSTTRLASVFSVNCLWSTCVM